MVYFALIDFYTDIIELILSNYTKHLVYKLLKTISIID